MVARNAEIAMRLIKKLAKDESGQDLVETILIVLIMALVVMAVFPAIGNAIKNAGNRIIDVINRALQLNF
jgi:Flp pilus assembly pilin Flp